VFNAQLLTILDARCAAIAAAGRRYISPCQRFGVAENDAAIQAAIDALRLDELKRSIRKDASETYNAFCRLVDQWDGTGPEPRLCADGN
jgi:hypothetical protein